MLMEKINDMIQILEEKGRFKETKNFIQHGDVSVYEHSILVAKKSLELAEKFNIDVDEEALIRGALLHDYFLYDWHEKDDSHKWHGFFHPMKSLKNAMRDFDISEIEEDIIKKHMFPLTPVPPKTKEGWLVCMADKICAMKETVEPRYKNIYNIIKKKVVSQIKLNNINTIHTIFYTIQA